MSKNNNQPLLQNSEFVSVSTQRNMQNLILQKGLPVQMGNGVARSWISTDQNNVPQEIGIEMTMNAIVNLPANHTEFQLLLPSVAGSLTPFTHIVINWHEHGHPPFFYQHPHFDFHFYTIPIAERLAIPSYASSPAGFDNNPPAGFLPPTYIAPPGGEEEKMGKHWVDATAPELPWNGGAPFTKTFIYGSYNGKVNFLEPMVTLATITSSVTLNTPFPQPAMFAQSKYYPTIYNVYKDNVGQTYNITLSNFVLR